MKVWPVILRELRAQAQQAFTYWLRTLGVMLLLTGGLIFLKENQDEADFGGILFGRLHLLSYLAIWLLVPLGAADCISRERREGTLGLLFLTPLRPKDIVIAKSIVHSVRALTLLVANVPVLTIPFLLGGVTWQQALISVAVNFSAICWCLAAALVASSLARQNGWALALAIMLALVGFGCFPWLIGALLGLNSQTTWNQGYSQAAYDFFAGFGVVALNFSDWIAVVKIFKLPQILAAMGMGIACSAAALIFAVLFAANRLRRSWRDNPPSARVQKLERTFCEPVLGIRILRRWMAHKLERNPIGWLEQRRWSGRLVTWVWFAIIISIYSVGLSDRNFFRNDNRLPNLLGWLLVFSLAVSATASFRRERESGVLELLLVSPLSVRQIINGRLRGLWSQFAPATLALLGLWAYMSNLYSSGQYYQYYNSSYGTGRAEIGFFAVSFVVIPVIGLFFSVSCRYLLTALLLTLGVVFALPTLLAMAVAALQQFFDSASNSLAWSRNLIESIVFFQLFLTCLVWFQLHRKLERREFPPVRMAS